MRYSARVLCCHCGALATRRGLPLKRRSRPPRREPPRLARAPGIDPAKFDRICHDEALGLEPIRGSGGRISRLGNGRLMPSLSARAFPARPWRVFRLGRTLGQTSDHARQDSLPRGLRDIHSGHQDNRPGEHLHAIPQNRVAFCVAVGRDTSISRAKPRLFGSCPRHSASFGNWRTFRRTRCNLNGGSGFCRFVRFRAAGCGRLRSRISRRDGCAIRVAL